MASKHFVGVGACYLDTILSVPHFIVEDEKLRASNIVRRRGGNCPNTVEVLQQLVAFRESVAIRVNLLVVFPRRSSTAVQELQQSLGAGISISPSLFREDYLEPASSYIVKNLSNGSRTIINYNDLPEMTFNEFVHATEPLGDTVAWYHFEGRIPDVTLRCIRYLRETFSGTKISVELEKPAREGLEQLVPEADLVFYSKSWALGKGYLTAEDCLRAQSKFAHKAALLCCTWGEQGASALQPKTMLYVQRAAHLPDGASVIDTIGAGDTFIAGMLYASLAHEGWSLDQKLDFSNELAGRKVAQEGFTGLAEAMQLRL